MTQSMVDLQLKFRSLIESFAFDEDGQDMIEYGLLAALISIVAIVIIALFGPYMRNLFQDVVNALGSA